ncbi:hypothetical protein [Actinokineospora spheciospongiae]|uniref:hypothetical protein n=1 Tax=Actinokineospora spheciospongiae TaxID=909613 RepID=UPI000D712C9E|nr:hypothetical protein [Actinokineospora spheciospongiae]PWW65524.1 hypothetical protein DFQ13_102276 [Actinokineospora spheciospongiae]
MSGSGFLAVDPGAAERAAAACRGQIARLDEHIRAVRDLVDPDFGACALGRGLTGKFTDKRTASDGLIARLVLARSGLDAAARHFESTARAYRDNEEGAAAALRGVGRA